MKWEFAGWVGWSLVERLGFRQRAVANASARYWRHKHGYRVRQFRRRDLAGQVGEWVVELWAQDCPEEETE